MKRDLCILISILLLTAAIVWLSLGRIAPAMAMQQGRDGQIVILDPGHGGVDGGTSDASGKKESELNLEIVLRTEQLMALLGIETELTRDADVSIHDDTAGTIHEKKVSDLKNRAALIAQYPNGMLLSVHQNAFPEPDSRGAQVFYGGGEVSLQWGELTQRVLQDTLGRSNTRKAKRIPGTEYLFQHVSCPAILVECGFLSNGEEASLLRSDTYQKKIAMALTAAYLMEQQMQPDIWRGE